MIEINFEEFLDQITLLNSNESNLQQCAIGEVARTLQKISAAMEQEGQILACFPTGKKEMNQKEVLERLLPIGERKPMFRRYLEKYLLNG